jgi:hypothetical protein
MEYRLQSAWIQPQSRKGRQGTQRRGDLGGRMEYRLQSAWLCKGSEGWNLKAAKAAKGSEGRIRENVNRRWTSKTQIEEGSKTRRLFYQRSKNPLIISFLICVNPVDLRLNIQINGENWEG